MKMDFTQRYLTSLKKMVYLSFKHIKKVKSLTFTEFVLTLVAQLLVQNMEPLWTKMPCFGSFQCWTFSYQYKFSISLLLF